MPCRFPFSLLFNQTISYIQISVDFPNAPKALVDTNNAELTSSFTCHDLNAVNMWRTGTLCTVCRTPTVSDGCFVYCLLGHIFCYTICMIRIFLFWCFIVFVAPRFWFAAHTWTSFGTLALYASCTHLCS